MKNLLNIYFLSFSPDFNKKVLIFFNTMFLNQFQYNKKNNLYFNKNNIFIF